MAFPFDRMPQGSGLRRSNSIRHFPNTLSCLQVKLNGLDSYALKYSPGVSTNLPGLGGFQNAALVFNRLQLVVYLIRQLAQGLQSFLGKGQRSALALWTLRSDLTAD